MLLPGDLFCSKTYLDTKVAECADKTLQSWNYVNPACTTGFLVFMSWQQNKVHITHCFIPACARILYALHPYFIDIGNLYKE